MYKIEITKSEKLNNVLKISIKLKNDYLDLYIEENNLPMVMTKIHNIGIYEFIQSYKHLLGIGFNITTELF